MIEAIGNLPTEYAIGFIFLAVLLGSMIGTGISLLIMWLWE